LWLVARRDRVRHDGHRRQRAHGLLALLPADPERVRLGPRRHRRRLFVRIPRLGRVQPAARSPRGPPRPAADGRSGRRPRRDRPAPGHARQPSLAPLSDARRAGRRRQRVPRLYRARALPASVGRALPRALRTTRFWWVVVAYFCGLFAWYAVQVHQTKYLTEIGFSPTLAAWALGLVSLAGIPGQVILGHVSDRVGREWVWTLGSLGFALCFALLLALLPAPTPLLLYSMG